jgi:hypothetical protein
LIAEREDSNNWYWKIFRWMTACPFLTIFVLLAIPNFLTGLSGLIAGRADRFGDLAVYLGLLWWYANHDALLEIF